jgi:predicted Zn finger-like uncharacterized protein
MQIICPHCTTSYAVNPANFGEGRKVRCARCQEVWMAQPEPMPAMAGRDEDDAYMPPQHQNDQAWSEDETPHVDSPSISGGWPHAQNAEADDDIHGHWDETDQSDHVAEPTSATKRWIPSLNNASALFRLPLKSALSLKLPFALPAINLNSACAAMGAMVLALLVWRSDVVRLMPQTAAFYKVIGMGVNLRGLSITDVKITVETVNNKPVLLIEGAIMDIARTPVEIPRLRFIVRDANGADLYAWNAVLEQPVLNPGDKALFKTRLAAPPPEGREIAVRFFHKQDIASGGT